MADGVLREEEDKLARESVRTLFFRHRLSLPGITVMMAALLFAYRGANPLHLATWAAVVGLNCVVQWWIIRFYFLNPSRFAGYGWARLLTASSGTLALALGLSPCFFLDLNNGTSVVLAMLFLVSPIYGSTVLAAPYFPIHVLWSLGSTLPLAWYFIRSGMADLVVLGSGILLAGTPSALVLGWILAGEFRRGLRMRFENVRLIGELRREKARVENISHDKSRFLAAVSHDLRQPLHALDLFHANLRSRLHGGAERELLELACNASHALGEMLGELVDIARLDSRRMQPRMMLAPVAPLLAECVAELRPQAEAKGIALRLRPPPDRWAVQTDPVLFKRILRNLLTNAIRYTERGGVLVGARIRGAMLRIEVHDTGPGIPREKLAHIFDEFYQVDNPERDREKGLGLGLAIVRRIAGLLGCSVDVSSRPGAGTSFYVGLPVRAFAEQRDAEAGRVAEDAGIAGMFVMVVDDDRMILRGMRGLLRDWGCEILAVESQEELMEEIARYDYRKPDMLIFDYRLRDGRTGVEAVNAVRDHFSDVLLPAAIVTGDMHPDMRREIDRANCLGLEKPVSAETLKSVLMEAASG